MLNVLIVDDEPEIAAGISFLIGRYCDDICRVAGTANDGLEGFGLAQELHPDIILSDIRMPECDGLEMINRLQKEGTNAKFVILSGYAEFSYARKAILLGVEDFLTKPVDEEELRNTLLAISTRISEEKAKAADNEYVPTREEVLDIDVRDYLQRRSQTDEETLKKRLKNIGFRVDAEKYICCLISVQDLEHTDIEQWRNIITAECEKISLLETSVTAVCEKDTFALLTGVGYNISIDDLLHSIRKLQNNIRADIQSFVCIGIGLFVTSFKEIPESFEAAQLALNYRILKGDNSIIAYKDIQSIETTPEFTIAQDMQELEEKIDQIDDEGTERVVRRIFDKIRKQENLSLETLQQISLNLVLFGIRKIPAAQLQMNQYLGKNIFTLKTIEKFDNIDQLENWIINMLKGMSRLMLKVSYPEKRDIVQEAKAYIRQNFDKNISLNDISEKFYINPYYFSQLFKKKTGMKYQDYVIGLRIDRAKKLLLETDMKLYEICTLVGYSDMNHFNRVFERETGVKPSEYRKTDYGDGN